MEALTVETFDVGFGDALLVTVPDGAGGVRRMLIDGGNAFAGEAGDDGLLLAVMERIVERLEGAPLDLYLSTHEHLDHIQGPGLLRKRTGVTLRARRVWMTASSAPDYYARHPEAHRRKRLAETALDEMALTARAMDGALPLWFDAMLAINNPRSSRELVDFIRDEMPMGTPVDYLARGAEPAPPFEDVQVRVLAPEQDSAVYYGRLRPPAAGAAALSTGPAAPPGVDPADFARLLEARARGVADDLMRIDRAGNDSSVVLELEWKGWRLLFPADAEEKSWEIMRRRDQLRPVHFLKVSHHASRNGSPAHAIDMVLPEVAPDGRPRFAVASTRAGAYGGVPDRATLERLDRRATVLTTETLERGGSHVLTFRADGSAEHGTTGGVGSRAVRA